VWRGGLGALPPEAAERRDAAPPASWAETAKGRAAERGWPRTSVTSRTHPRSRRAVRRIALPRARPAEPEPRVRAQRGHRPGLEAGALSRLARTARSPRRGPGEGYRRRVTAPVLAAGRRCRYVRSVGSVTSARRRSVRRPLRARRADPLGAESCRRRRSVRGGADRPTAGEPWSPARRVALPRSGATGPGPAACSYGLENKP
jgi:hypothetical protein